MKTKIMVSLAVTICFSIMTHSLTALESSAIKNSATFQQPLLFEPNVGQAESAVKYLARGQGYVLYLTKQGARILFRNQEGCESEIRIRLEGSQPDPAMVGIRNSEAKVHYYLGNDPQKWQTDISTFGAIVYKDIYPGIDWMFYERDGLLEYDLIVAPGVDASQIRLKVEGADQKQIDEKGRLNITTEAGSFQMSTPMVIQGSDEIEAKYLIASDDSVQFEVGSYDRSKPLIIDPQISYGTLLGGNTYDTSLDVAADNKGNFYVVGYTEANTRFPGFGDGFIYKFNPSGAVVWSAFLVGNSGDSADAIAVAPNGTCYVVGTTSSNDFPIVGGFQARNAGGNDAFLVKLAANGSGIVRSTYLGGSGNDGASGIEIGTGPKLRNGLYVTGKTDSRNFPLKNATQNQFGGGREDGFLTIVHSVQFTNLMSTYVGLDGTDQITSLALNTTRGDLYGTVLSNDGTEGSYVAHFKPKTASTIAAKSLAAPETVYEKVPRYVDEILSRSGGGAGQRLVLYWYHAFGRFTTTRFSPNAQQDIWIAAGTCIPQPPATSCNDNGTLFSFDQDLNYLGSASFGGTGPGAYFVNDVAVSRIGTIYISGHTLIKTLPLVNAFQTKHNGGWEGFIITISPTNQTTMYSYLGSAGHDYATDIAADNAGNVFVVGQTSSKKFPTTPTAIKRTLGGTADGYVVKISP